MKRYCAENHLIAGNNVAVAYSYRKGKRLKYDRCRTCRNAQAKSAMAKMRKVQAQAAPPEEVSLKLLRQGILAVRNLTKIKGLEPAFINLVTHHIGEVVRVADRIAH